MLPLVVDEFWSCSSFATEFSFPKKVWKKTRYIPNGVDLEKFQYNEEIRKEMRNTLSLSDQFVVGHAGRFNHQKNHDFLIDIFSELHKVEPSAVLVLCGVGELEENIKEKVYTLGLKDNVIFYGGCNEMEKMYQAWDVFVLPSKFEGLPVTGVEAQASGLPLVLSDVITKEVAVTDAVCYVSLNKSEEEWARTILSCKGYRRNTDISTLRRAGFDQKKMVDDFQNYYLNILKNI